MRGQKIERMQGALIKAMGMMETTLRFMALVSVPWALDLIRVQILKVEVPMNATISHNPI